MGTYWFDNMTFLIDVIHDIQKEIAKTMQDTLESRETLDSYELIGLSSVLVFTLILCPLILNSVYSLTSEIQGYSVTLADR